MCLSSVSAMLVTGKPGQESLDGSVHTEPPLGEQWSLTPTDEIAYLGFEGDRITLQDFIHDL